MTTRVRYLPTPHSPLPTPLRPNAVIPNAVRDLLFLRTSARSLTRAARIFFLLTTNHYSLITAFFLLVTCHLSLVTVLSAQGITPQSIITTVAGTPWTFRGDGGLAINAPLGQLGQVAVDSGGNIFVADPDNHIVVRIDVAGMLSVVAGNNIMGFTGDGGPATSAALNSPHSVALDAAGNLYIADTYNHRIRKVGADGRIITVVGSGPAGRGLGSFSGDGGQATAARLAGPFGVAIDRTGILYIADTNNNRVRRVNLDGTIATIAGSGAAGFSGDGGQATGGRLSGPFAVAINEAGDVYIADSNNSRVRRVGTDGIITTVAGNGAFAFSGDGGQATSASLNVPRALNFDAGGNLYIADAGNNSVRKLGVDGVITSVPFAGAWADPQGVATDVNGNLYVAEGAAERLKRLTPEGLVSTIAGNGNFKVSGDGGPATSATLHLSNVVFYNRTGIAIDMSGNFYIGDSFSYRVRKVGVDGIINTVAGNGTQGFSGDNGPAFAATLALVRAVSVDRAGNLYIAGQQRIRKVTPDGIITTVAGNGIRGFSGDGGPAIQAALATVFDVSVDATGNIYIADQGNHRIRKVTPDALITTVAGNGTIGFSGDGGPATNAALNFPTGITTDAAGNFYIADSINNRIRKVNPSGIITTVAGNGKLGFSGDGGPAVQAMLNAPTGVTLDAAGNLYIADYGNGRVRRVAPGGVITTVAGKGTTVLGGGGFSGDGGPATDAVLNFPSDVKVDDIGNLYITDLSNDRIRKVLAPAPPFSVSPGILNFAAPVGVPSLVPQRFTVSSPITGLAWRAETSTKSGGNWLTISPTTATMPTVVDAKVDATNLTPGEYQGTVAIIAPLAVVPTQTIAVTMTVQASPVPKLVVDPSSLTFETLAGGSPPGQMLRIGNAGGESLNWTARTETTSGGNWLSVIPASGTATAGASNQVQVSANSSTLAAGVYSGAVVVGSATTSATLRVPVSLLVSQSRQTILMSQSGLLFTAVEGGSLIPPQTFGVLNTGEGVMSWTAQASTLAGGNWLSVSPTNASTDAASLRVPLVNVAVNVTGLSAGQYSGLIRVSAATANNSPQFVTVELNVLPRGSNPAVLVRPTGLIFAAQAGTSSPGSLTVNLGTVVPGNVDTVSGLLTRDGATWLEAVPRNLTLSAGDAIQRIVVQPTLGTLAPGVYRGALTLLFSDSSSAQVVNILFLVVSGRAGNPSRANPSRDRERAGMPADGFASEPSRSAGSASGLDSLGPLPYGRGSDSRGVDGCAATQLLATHRTLGTNFASPVGWPSTVEAQVADDCGNAVPNATVVARFSNGDPLTVLTSLRNGLYVGTWRPVNTTGQVTVTVRAELPPLAPVEVQAQGQVSANAAVPALSAGGVVNAASFAKGEAVAPGSLVSIFGTKLAVGEGAATRLPLENQLAGTSVTIGGQPIPLLYASEGQVNAVVPYGLAVNTRQQIVVRRGNSYSVPEPVTVAAAQPAVFTKDQTGKGQGLIFVAASGGQRLADAASPARAGDAVVIYCSGLGAVNPPVAAGAAAPSSPLSVTANPVSVTIGGREAQVLFAGLAPGFAGLYQVNVIVPGGVNSGNEVSVSLTVAGQTSPPVTFAVR